MLRTAAVGGGVIRLRDRTTSSRTSPFSRIKRKVARGSAGARAGPLLARDPATVDELLKRSIAIKTAVVMGDEREGGRRAILNAGHTVAHAVEWASGFAILHGEAVAIGLVTEARLGEQLGVTAPGTASILAQLLEALGLPTALPPALDIEVVLSAMRADKKNLGGTIRFAFIQSLGLTREPWTTAVAPEAIRAALR